MRFWTEEEWAILQSMKEAGHQSPAIAERLGRSIKSILAKLEWSKLTPEMKKKRYRSETERRRRGYRVRKPDGTLPKAETPPEVLADRDWRCCIPPRDLTAAFFGDPLPGYSALERRS